MHDHIKSFFFKSEAISLNVFYVEAAEQITFVLARMKRLVEHDRCLTVRAKFPCCCKKLRKLSEKHTFSVCTYNHRAAFVDFKRNVGLWTVTKLHHFILSVFILFLFFFLICAPQPYSAQMIALLVLAEAQFQNRVF